MQNKNTLITILGPTAIGKTRLAVSLADKLNGEIISADSRQVYQNMDIGTGKDLADYTVDGKQIPYHLIDVVKAGEKYDVFQFQQDFYNCYNQIRRSDKQAILCGGSGLYLEAALAEKSMLFVPENIKLREELDQKSQQELNEILLSIQPNLHNTTDLKDKSRSIRAIEIAKYEKENPDAVTPSPVKHKLTFGLKMEREKLRDRIKSRLQARLEQGMIDEVQELLNSAIPSETLNYYGLEYRFINQYLQAEISYDQMFNQLLQGIRRFAKKQMTWFRRMEKRGEQIKWLEAEDDLAKNIEIIEQSINGKAV